MFMVRCKVTHQDGRVLTVDGKDPEACDRKATRHFKCDIKDLKIELVGRTLEGRRGSNVLKTFYTFEEVEEIERKLFEQRKERLAQG